VRIARFVHPGGVSFGAVEGEAGAPPDALTVAEFTGLPMDDEVRFTGQRWALADVRLLAPIFASKVVCVGRNYVEHAAEHGAEVPAEPLLFLKPSTSVIGPNGLIRLPADSDQVEHEAELAVVIGRVVKDVPRERAMDVIFGYTCGNDVTARDQQRTDGQWTRAKGYDSFCPIGPWIETDVDVADLRVTTTLNGEVKQDGRTSQLVHKIPTLISYITSCMTLLPGDVILTGTPAGVGPMQAGDQVVVEIERIGRLTKSVLAG